MHAQLRRALAPVLHDLEATGAPVPRLLDDDWTEQPDTASAMLGSGDGSRIGVHVTLDRPVAEQVADVADQVQEWATEELWGAAPTNWPPCPRHPLTHPLAAVLRAGEPWWSCPGDGGPASRIGALG